MSFFILDVFFFSFLFLDIFFVVASTHNADTFSLFRYNQSSSTHQRSQCVCFSQCICSSQSTRELAAFVLPRASVPPKAPEISVHLIWPGHLFLPKHQRSQYIYFAQCICSSQCTRGHALFTPNPSTSLVQSPQRFFFMRFFLF